MSYDCDDQSCVFSWQGGHHLEDNSPRQDRVAMAQLPSSQGKLVIVSDGLGSCHLSHLGAQLAIDAMRFPPWLKRWDDLLAKVDTTKESTTQSNDPNALILNKTGPTITIKKDEKDYKSINSYEPTGKLIYNTDLIKRIEDKFT